jgi:hypothetical protein
VQEICTVAHVRCRRLGVGDKHRADRHARTGLASSPGTPDDSSTIGGSTRVSAQFRRWQHRRHDVLDPPRCFSWRRREAKITLLG